MVYSNRIEMKSQNAKHVNSFIIKVGPWWNWNWNWMLSLWKWL